MAQTWPKGNSEKHAEAARKGWETRRANARAGGYDVGSTVGHAKRQSTREREARPKQPVTTAEKRRAAYKPKFDDYWTRVVVSHEKEADAYRAVGGGISAPDRKKAKAKARWHWEFLETRDPRTGMHGGRWIHVDYQ